MRIAAAIVAFLTVPSLFAATSDDFLIPADVVGGGGVGRSDRYILSDSIAEPVIGEGTSDDYKLQSGYLAGTGPLTVLSIGCATDAVHLGSLLLGQSATSTVSCVVVSSDLGYQLRWQVPAGSGGTATGSLINQRNQTIGPFNPTVENVPATWSIGPTDAAWAGRIGSSSTDAEAEWGIDNSSEKWLNISPDGRTIISRSTPTTNGGSTIDLHIRAGVGASSNQPDGTYRTSVSLLVIDNG